MTINRLIFLCFFFSYSLAPMELDEAKEEALTNYFASISAIIRINNDEIDKNKKREYWFDKIHKGISSSVFIVPYGFLYYGSVLYPDYTDMIKYCFPPITLWTYYLTINENYKKTLTHSVLIEQDIMPLHDLLPNIRRVLEYAQQDERLQDISINNSGLLHHIDKIEQENQYVYKFFIDVLLSAAKKYQNNPDMMGQVISGNQELRLVILFSFLKLLEHTDKNYGFFTDIKPSINIAAFDTWKVTLHGYPVLVGKCADELNNNLILLKESPEKLRAITFRPLVKTIIVLLAKLIEARDNNKS